MRSVEAAGGFGQEKALFVCSTNTPPVVTPPPPSPSKYKVSCVCDLLQVSDAIHKRAVPSRKACFGAARTLLDDMTALSTVMDEDDQEEVASVYESLTRSLGDVGSTVGALVAVCNQSVEEADVPLVVGVGRQKYRQTHRQTHTNISAFPAGVELRAARDGEEESPAQQGGSRVCGRQLVDAGADARPA